MLGLELVVVLGVCVLVSSAVAGRLRVAPPVLLLVCGVLLGFVPALRVISFSVRRSRPPTRPRSR